jgi:BirA family transcriptional regulator, biotin operon repressor / biotin---[acetyl-CoA-carboxylase] ligase
MDFPLSSAQVSRLHYVATTGSTNADLSKFAKTDPANWPDKSVMVANYQDAGRGRLDRSWIAPEGSSLMASILVRPKFANPSGFGWLSLLLGLAITETIHNRSGIKVGMKWPNDVLIADRKVSGILAEALPDLSGVVIGFGLNLHQSPEELPVESATSLAMESVTDLDKDKWLSEILERFNSEYKLLVENLGDANGSGLRRKVLQKSATIGEKVRVLFPDETELLGLATSMDETGRLLLDVSGKTTAISAGDVLHLRKQ